MDLRACRMINHGSFLSSVDFLRNNCAIATSYHLIFRRYLRAEHIKRRMRVERENNEFGIETDSFAGRGGAIGCGHMAQRCCGSRRGVRLFSLLNRRRLGKILHGSSPRGLIAHEHLDGRGAR